jgi:putative N6-adenine-specific DNA methylase
VLEAAEIACGLAPGRARAFAFERLANFDQQAWEALRAAATPQATSLRFHGMDRDAGAIEASRANAARAGVAACTVFVRQAISALEPPEGPKGLVLVNPPYGARIGERAELRALYATLGRVLAERFGGWRVGIVTSEPGLAAATGLGFLETGPPVPHGKLRVRLHRTGPLP